MGYPFRAAVTLAFCIVINTALRCNSKSLVPPVQTNEARDASRRSSSNTLAQTRLDFGGLVYAGTGRHGRRRLILHK